MTGKKNQNPYKVDKKILLTSILFIVYPLASVPFSLLAMIKREKYGFILFGLFMGLIGLLVPPTGDFYRYTQDAWIIKNLSWEDFLLYSSLKFDFLLTYLSYGLSVLGLNFDLSRFIYNSVSYILLGFLYLKLVNSNPNINKNDWTLLVIFITFSLSTFLFRFFFSMILFLYGSYELILFNKKKGWIFIILAVLNHVTYIIFLFGLLISRIKFFRLGKKMVLLMCSLSLVLDSSFLIYIMKFIPVDIVDRFMIYLDGYWAGDFVEDHSYKYKVMLLIGSGIVYAGVIIYYLIYKYLNKIKIGFSNFILFTVVITSPFAIINGRFLQIFFYNFKILFLRYYQNNNLFKKCKYTLLLLTILSTLSGLWANRRQWSLGDGSMLLYSSFPSVISHTYSEEWISKHIFKDGDFVQ